MNPFHLESIPAGSYCAVLQVTGEVDVYTAPELRERVIQLLADGAIHIIVDLRDVHFLDSTGLGTLVGSLRRVRTLYGSLMLVASARRILEIFNVTGLSNAFTIYPSIPAAIAASEPWQAAVAREGNTAEEWSRKHGLALPRPSVPGRPPSPAHPVGGRRRCGGRADCRPGTAGMTGTKPGKHGTNRVAIIIVGRLGRKSGPNGPQ